MSDTKDHKCPSQKNDTISAKWCDITQHEAFCDDNCAHNKRRDKSKYQVAKNNFDERKELK